MKIHDIGNLQSALHQPEAHGTGRTTNAIEFVQRVGGRLIVHSEGFARYVHHNHEIAAGTLDRLLYGHYRGTREPIVLDHHVVEILVADMRKTLGKKESELAEARKEVGRLERKWKRGKSLLEMHERSHRRTLEFAGISKARLLRYEGRWYFKLIRMLGGFRSD